ncbi:MAG: CDP-diacylglycerol--serine O-phosphatidyltransferase [Gemmatimonadaceae bacterium]
MTTAKLRRPKRPNMRRAVILFPSGLTLGNLFFGVFAIITASRGDFRMAGIYVLWGGLCDVFDGRIARAANAGTEFGEELDSLVDAISFGLAPAMIMYFAVLNRDGWDWIFVFLFAACAVMRLARFNIEQAGTSKTYFQGLPSPAAGITLASYYWFSQSWLYSYGAIGDLRWTELLRFLMAALAFLMISNIPYPVVPRVGFRSLRAIGASILVFGSLALLATRRLEFFFPLCVGYVAFGLFRSLFFRIFERRQPTVPYDLSEGEGDEDEEEFDVEPQQVHAPRQGHREGKMARSDTVATSPRTQDRPSRADRPERSPRPDRPERTTEEKGPRPQRTEAERAARREKREKRDNREARPDRGPRPPRTAEEAVTAVAVADELTGAESPSDSTDEEVIGRISGGPDTAVATVGAEGGAPARKRKRRRRRGERKERAPGDVSSAEGADSGGGDDSDGGFDDGPADSDSSSPYSAPVSTGLVESHVPTPPPLPPAAPPPAPSTEPHEP